MAGGSRYIKEENVCPVCGGKLLDGVCYRPRCPANPERTILDYEQPAIDPESSEEEKETTD